jgi:hypothetical protein
VLGAAGLCLAIAPDPVATEILFAGNFASYFVVVPLVK